MYQLISNDKVVKINCSTKELLQLVQEHLGTYQMMGYEDSIDILMGYIISHYEGEFDWNSSTGIETFTVQIPLERSTSVL
jgi:hypothetical protein